MNRRLCSIVGSSLIAGSAAVLFNPRFTVQGSKNPRSVQQFCSILLQDVVYSGGFEGLARGLPCNSKCTYPSLLPSFRSMTRTLPLVDGASSRELRAARSLFFVTSVRPLAWLACWLCPPGPSATQPTRLVAQRANIGQGEGVAGRCRSSAIGSCKWISRFALTKSLVCGYAVSQIVGNSLH